MLARIVIAVAFSLAALAGARAENHLVVEDTFLSVEIKGEPFRLQALAVKEAGASKKLPVAIITHGQAAELEQREKVSPRAYQYLAREFARRGWLAVVVVRRGFGRSEGKQPYFVRGCENGNFGAIFEDQADDLQAAMAAIGRRHDANMDEVIAVGVSVGGGTVLSLGARNPAGLKAVINFSGGIKVVERPDLPPSTCKADDLMPTFADFGARSRVPSLWFYAENDSFFPADYARKLHEAYVAKGGKTEFHMFEPIGKDGHDIIANLDGALHWLPAMDTFLRTNLLATFEQTAMDRAVRGLADNSTVRRLLSQYHGRPTDKAFAMSQSNNYIQFSYGGADIEAVSKHALERCAEGAKEPCRIVMRNFEVVKEAVAVQNAALAKKDAAAGDERIP
jgi:dienelactone hydrolase